MNNSKKIITIAIIIVIIVGAGAFYGGTIYQKNKLASQGLLRGANGGNFQGGANGQRGQGQNGQGGQRMGGANNPNGGGFATGDVISKDDKSVTIKTNDGGSKIVYFSTETKIGKTTDGSITDLNVGQQLMVNGKTNSDGSLTANNIQIRPAQTPAQ